MSGYDTGASVESLGPESNRRLVVDYLPPLVFYGLQRGIGL